jgi:2-aminoadipate transaminase
MKSVPASFIREILKLTQSPEVISFAGGLPNPHFFPVKEISDATVKVLSADGKNVLQYSTTEGHLPLREFICKRYKEKKGLEVTPDEILITSGSQQAIALLCKTFLNKGEPVVMERPGYLGAIQAISFYEPDFKSVTLEDDGINTAELEHVYNKNQVKLYYSVVNFQNPTGTTYTLQKRKEVAEILSRNNSIFIEDDPYYDLRFKGEYLPSIKTFHRENVILTGSFSKVASPSFRIGWIYAQKNLMEKIVISKQAADLHSSSFSQRVLHQYLTDNDIDKHIAKIIHTYSKQKEAMVESIKRHFPEEVTHTNPDGGMFLWARLPENLSCRDLLPLALKENVAFVPGDTFFIGGGGLNTMRLNFTNSHEDRIEEGIKRLAKVIKQLLVESRSESVVSP